MEKQVETLTTELENTTTQQALQEQIEKLVQLQKVEAEKQTLQEAVQQEVIV